MEFPWTKLEKKVATALDNLLKRLDSGDKQTFEKMMKQLNLVKTSEQTKHNRNEQRLNDLEGAIEKQLEAYKKLLDDREKEAAKEADERLGVEL
jgi:hypothetical protein